MNHLTKPLMERLEDRILFDAVPDAQVVSPELSSDAPEQALSMEQLQQDESRLHQERDSARWIVVIDPSVQSPIDQIEKFMANQNLQGFEVRLLNEWESGIAQVDSLLQDLRETEPDKNIGASESLRLQAPLGSQDWERSPTVLLLTQGGKNGFRLGNDLIDQHALEQSSDRIAAWGNHLLEDRSFRLLTTDALETGSDIEDELVPLLEEIRGLVGNSFSWSGEERRGEANALRKSFSDEVSGSQNLEVLGRNTQPQSSSSQIVFVDSSVSEYDKLLHSMKIPENVEVIVLQKESDGVLQMASALQGRSGVSAIHILSHGSVGQLNLGNTQLDATGMQGAYNEALRSIGMAMTEDGDILIYGCDFSANDSGLEAAQWLSQVTGADVASSNNRSGHAQFAGDWILENQTGDVQALVLADSGALGGWLHVMAPLIANPDNAVIDESTATIHGAPRTLLVDTGEVSGIVSVDLATGIATPFSTPGGYNDIARSPEGVVYGLKEGHLLYRLDGQPLLVGSIRNSATGLALSGNYNSMEFSADGVLYLSDGEQLYSVDPLKAEATYLGQIGDVPASGDIVILGNVLYMTTLNGLAKVDLSNVSPGTTEYLSFDGADQVYAMGQLDEHRIVLLHSFGGDPTPISVFDTRNDTFSSISTIELHEAQLNGGATVFSPQLVAEGNVLSNDSDPDSPTLTVLHFGVFSQEATGSTVKGNFGELTMESDGSYVYRVDIDSPEFQSIDFGSSQIDEFIYWVESGDGDTDTATLTITVTGRNHAPDAIYLNPYSFSETETGIVVGSLHGSDREGHSMTYTTFDSRFEIVNGNDLRLKDGEIVDYENPPYDVVVIATDELGASRSHRVNLLVSDVDEIEDGDEIAYPIYNSIGGWSGNMGNVLTNTTDPDGGSGAFFVTTFTVEGVIHAAGEIATFANGATFQLHGDGSWVYHDVGYMGVRPSVIEYTVSDGPSSDTSFLTLHTNSTEDLDSTVLSYSPTLAEDTSHVGNLAHDWTDPEGDTLSIQEILLDTDGDGVLESFAITAPSHSFEILGSDGLPLAKLEVHRSGTYSVESAPNFNSLSGTHLIGPWLKYQLVDAYGGKSPTFVFNNLFVNSVNDAPSGSDVQIQTVVNTPYVLNTDDFGFSDLADGDAGLGANRFMSVVIEILPNSGVLSLNGVSLNAGDEVTTEDIQAGRLVWTPPSDVLGTDIATFTFQVRDDGSSTLLDGYESQNVQMNGSISGNLLDNTIQVALGRTPSIREFSVDANDDGVDEVFPLLNGESEIVILRHFDDSGSTPELKPLGTLTISNDGAFTFTPENGYMDSVPHITYTVTDGLQDFESSLSMSIDPAEQNNAYDDLATTPWNTPITIDLLGNDVIQNGPASIVSLHNSSRATIDDNGDGTITYTPPLNFTGTDRIQYSFQSLSGALSVANVYVRVLPQTGVAPAPQYDIDIDLFPKAMTFHVAENTSPTALDDSIAAQEDSLFTGRLPAVTDPDPDTHTYALDTPPAHGKAWVNSDGTFSYLANPHYHGPDSFTYLVTDNHGASATATIQITVSSAIDAPVLDLNSGLSDFDLIEHGDFSVTNTWSATPAWNYSGSASTTQDTGTHALTTPSRNGWSTGPSAFGAALLSFDIRWDNGSPAASSTSNLLEIQVSGVTYVRIISSQGDGTMGSVEYLHGANGNLFQLAAGSVERLIIDLPKSVRDSGWLEFSYTGGGAPTDKFTIDNVSAIASRDFSPGTGFEALFTQGGTPVQIVGPLTSIDDLDDSQMDSARVVFKNPQPGDVLRLHGVSLEGGMSATYLGIPYTVSVVGDELIVDFTAPAANSVYSQIFQAFTFEATAENPSAIDREVQFTVFDGDATSNTASSIIHLAVAPVATNNINSVIENNGSAATGNVLTDDDGDGVDRDGNLDVFVVSEVNGTSVDGATTIHGHYGTLTIAPDGTYSYALNEANLSVNVLRDGQSLEDVFSYTISELGAAVGNGSFEEPMSGDPNTGWFGPSAQFATANQMNSWGAGYTFTDSPDGGGLVRLVGNGFDPLGSSGWIQQNISGLAVGELYEISFYQTISSQHYFDNLKGFIQVTFGTDVSNAPTQAPTAVGTPSTWQLVTMTFTATAPTQTLELRGIPIGGGGWSELAADGLRISQLSGTKLSDSASLTITIHGANDAPVDSGESIVFDEDSIKSGNLLINATDAEGDTLVIQAFTVNGQPGPFQVGSPYSIPGTGTIHIQSNGEYTFEPIANFFGSVPVITYTVSDGNGGTDTCELKLTVAPVNDQPILDLDSDNSSGGLGIHYQVDFVPGSGPVRLSDVDGSISDAGENDLVRLAVEFDFSQNPTEEQILFGSHQFIHGTPVSGLETIGGTTFWFEYDGVSSLVVDALSHNSGIAIPIDDYRLLLESFSYNHTGIGPSHHPTEIRFIALDSSGQSTTAVASVRVDQTPVAVDDDFATPQNQLLIGDVTPGTQGQDRDAEGPIRVTHINGIPLHSGSPFMLPSGVQLTMQEDGSFTLNTNGHFTYLLPNESHEVRFEYTVTDSRGLTATATVSVHVLGTFQGQSPIAQNDLATLIGSSVSGNALSNDVDPDGDVLVGQISVRPQHGQVIWGQDGQFTYLPGPTFRGFDQFTYLVYDSSGFSSTGIVQIRGGFGWDSFNNFSQAHFPSSPYMDRDFTLGEGSREVVLMTQRLEHFASQPILAGYARPGTILIGRVYSIEGGVLAESHVRVNSAGNWLMEFQGIHASRNVRIVIEHCISDHSAQETTYPFRLTPDTYRSLQMGVDHKPSLSAASILSDTPAVSLEMWQQQSLHPLRLL